MHLIAKRGLTRGSTRPIPAGFARLHGRVNRNVRRHADSVAVAEGVFTKSFASRDKYREP